MMIRTIFWDQHIIGRSQCLWSFVKFLRQEEAALREDGSSFPFKELLWWKRTKGEERNSTLFHLILIATCLDQAALVGPVGQFWVRQGWKLRVICLFVDLSFLLSMLLKALPLFLQILLVLLLRWLSFVLAWPKMIELWRWRLQSSPLTRCS